MCYSDCDFINSKRDPIEVFGIPKYESFDRINLLEQNFIFISSVVHRCTGELLPLFDSGSVPMEDWEMWIRISENNKIKCTNKKTVSYMWKTEGSYYTRDESNKAKVRILNANVKSKHQD